MSDPLYQQERALRNSVLLRPIGIPDFGWEMNDKASWHFVAVEMDKVIGCVVLYHVDKQASRAQLMQMAVDHSSQGKGVGKKLVSYLLEFARNQGLKEIIIHSRSSVNAFYKQFGFEMIGEEFEEVGIAHSNLTLSLL